MTRPRLTKKDKTKPPRTTISVSLKFPLRDELKVMADEEETSVAAIIEGLLKYYREAEGLNDE